MRRALLLAIGLVLCSMPTLAGEYLMNEEVAYGLRVTFSEPVTLTYFGDVLMQVSPEGEAAEFLFSGAELPAWVGHGLAWTPASARIVDYEWLATPPSVVIPEGGLTREDLWNLGRPPTYEEIMAAIAEYPGPDEPLYEPAPDEAIWLTDLEGHADIYDNDSIRINYADWFNQSQITKIEVYRNDAKMRFLPASLDVLTNAQMKTFDGNFLEHTPASNHADHAVWGYEYSFFFYEADSTPSHWASKRVICPFVPSFELCVNTGVFYNVLETQPDSVLLRQLEDLREHGFSRVLLTTYYYVASNEATDFLLVASTSSPITHSWSRSMSLAELERAIRLIHAAELETELRVELWLSQEYKQRNPGTTGWDRAGLRPADVDEWFTNYEELWRPLAKLAEREGVEVLCLGAELDSMEAHTEHWRALTGNLRALFSGQITYDESTHAFLGLDHAGRDCHGRYGFENCVGSFWDAMDLIEMNSYPMQPELFALETQKDQRFSVLLERFVELWLPAVAHYRRLYPDKPLWFGEMGALNFDGNGMYGHIPDLVGSTGHDRDLQEVADIWAASLAGAYLLGVDGIDVWSIDFEQPWSHDFVGSHYINHQPAFRLITGVLQPF